MFHNIQFAKFLSFIPGLYTWNLNVTNPWESSYVFERASTPLKGYMTVLSLKSSLHCWSSGSTTAGCRFCLENYTGLPGSPEQSSHHAFQQNFRTLHTWPGWVHTEVPWITTGCFTPFSLPETTISFHWLHNELKLPTSAFWIITNLNAWSTLKKK